MAEKRRINRRLAAAVCAAALAVSGMGVCAADTKADYQTVSETDTEVTLTLQEIVDANTGIENVLGSAQMIGVTSVKYDTDGNLKDSSQYAFTRTDDSYGYAVAIIYEDYILTYKSGSAYVQYNSGQQRAMAVDADEYASVISWVKEFSTVGYSETETLTAQYEKDGLIYVKSEDPEAEDSADGYTACFYYVLDKDTLQCQKIIESLADSTGAETKILEMTVEYSTAAE